MKKGRRPQDGFLNSEDCTLDHAIPEPTLLLSVITSPRHRAPQRTQLATVGITKLPYTFSSATVLLIEGL